MSDYRSLALDYVRAVCRQTGLTPSALAERAGISPSTLNKKLKSPDTEAALKIHTLEKIAAISGIPIPISILQSPDRATAPPIKRELITPQHGGATASGVRVPPPDWDGLPPPPPIQTNMAKDLPVYGVSRAGNDGSFILNGEVIDVVRRPRSLSHASRAFALYVEGDSMTPRYDPGDLVFVNPGRPARPGDDVIIEFHPGEDDTQGPAYLKKLVRQNSNEIIVEQYNPAKTYTIPRAQVRAILYVLSRNELFSI